jgi:hypothetical protein
MTETIDLNNSNDFIVNKIIQNKPFMICRVSDNITKLSIYYSIHKTIHPHFKQFAETHDGIYAKNDSELVLYSKMYINTLKNMDGFACFPKLYTQTQNIIINSFNIQKERILKNRILEPFYLLEEQREQIPWTHYLKDKKVLIISPFIETFKKQMENGFSFFGEDDDRRIWDEKQQFLFYKAYNTLYGNHIHNNWFETFSKMCEDIKELDFDIALLSCGGYGLPLCNFIRSKLGKSSIYVGGCLQLLFGVYGKRWINHYIIGKLICKEGSKWIRPSVNERLPNYQKVEGGCYW